MEINGHFWRDISYLPRKIPTDKIIVIWLLIEEFMRKGSILNSVNDWVRAILKTRASLIHRIFDNSGINLVGSRVDWTTHEIHDRRHLHLKRSDLIIFSCIWLTYFQQLMSTVLFIKNCILLERWNTIYRSYMPIILLTVNSVDECRYITIFLCVRKRA